MAEYSASAVQIVNPGETIIFTETVVPCELGLIKHRDGTGSFLLSGWVPNSYYNRVKTANYLVEFGANISVPEGGTAGEISVAVSIDGNTLPETQMIVTPAAVDEYFNVARATSVGIFRGCCETVAVRNTSDQSIQVSNPNIRLVRSDLHKMF